MLDWKVVREFLDEKLEKTEIPDDIFKEALVETFCNYVEDDYYEWLKDNLKSFFNKNNRIRIIGTDTYFLWYNFCEDL